MSDPLKTDDPDAALRDRAPLPNKGMGAGRTLSLVALLCASTAAGAWVVLREGDAPKAMEASRAADFQSEAGEGFLGMTAGEFPATRVAALGQVEPPPNTQTITEPDGAADAAAELRETIAALRAEIAALGGAEEENAALAAILEQNQALMTRLETEAADREAALAKQARLFDAELKRSLAAQRAELDADHLAELDRMGRAAEEARLEARSKAEAQREAEALRDRQIASSLTVIDDSSLSGANYAGEAAAPPRPKNDNERFLAAAAGETVKTAAARPLANPSRMIVQGAFIAAALETAIQSDLPGTIRAVVADDVRSYDGSAVLLPRGTRLIGTYRSDLSVAQSRALVAWTRAVTPDGLSIMLGSSGGDRLGRAGQTGDVDTHFFERFGSAALISLIGAIPVLAADQTESEATRDLALDVGRDFRSATSDAMSDYLRIPPTIHVDQGTEITVIVQRDLFI